MRRVERGAGVSPRMLASAAVALALACSGALARAEPGAVRDDFGRAVAVRPLPHRVVTLAPHATELAFAAGLGARLVAVDPSSDRPAAIADLPRVAPLPEPDAEALLRLAPDLVVLWGAGLRAGAIERLGALGTRVFVSQPRRLEDIADSIERLGRFSPEPEAALRAAADLRRRMSAATATSGTGAPVRVFYQVWSRPLMTVGDRDLIGDAIAACGGVNVFGQAPVAAFAVDREAVLARAPELIVVADRPDATVQWEDLRRAQRALRVVYLPADDLQRPSPSIVPGLRALCEQIERTRNARDR